MFDVLSRNRGLELELRGIYFLTKNKNKNTTFIIIWQKKRKLKWIHWKTWKSIYYSFSNPGYFWDVFCFIYYVLRFNFFVCFIFITVFILFLFFILQNVICLRYFIYRWQLVLTINALKCCIFKCCMIHTVNRRQQCSYYCKLYY